MLRIRKSGSFRWWARAQMPTARKNIARMTIGLEKTRWNWTICSLASKPAYAGFDAKEHIVQFHRVFSSPIVILAMFFLAVGICARAHHRKLPLFLILSTIAIGFSYFIFLTTFQSLGIFHEWPIVFTIWLPHLLFLTLVFTYILHQDSPNF